ncbi:GNT-I family protein [Robiginitalea myxolifaciens]|uniref:GNT-I family protein n=1 Tax=Robiginitalea myxolifaciens TaxID=400055 RepID=A0A1I6H1S1_9FLAO|nr:GNT-I family protein [Robiginitalea myxolifaciens]
MSSRTPIIVIAYNRPDSLSRLLKSLNRAVYSSKDIPLIISIDRAESNGDVLTVAESFSWKHGDKQINYQEVNLGLRKHVLQCGDLSQDYGSVILLEDDLIVARDFYNYTSQALSFAESRPYISGVSLYNHKQNVLCQKQFSPMEDGYDNWYFQFASSWGQAWTSSQWRGFREWYKDQGVLEASDDLPAYVSAWSEKSWLKYFIQYLVETKTYFLYPKIGLSTNFGDSGTHVQESNTDYQIPLFEGVEKQYQFSDLDSSKSVYDVFFENENLNEALGVSQEELTVDLYGTKHNPQTRYLLSSRKIERDVIKRFGRKLKPRDANIIHEISGTDYFLYDMEKAGQLPDSDSDLAKELFYETKVLYLREVIRLARFLVVKKLKRFFS